MSDLSSYQASSQTLNHASTPAFDILTPDWPAPAHVRALCTTRAGGVSQPPYDSLNLGDHVGDSPQAVAANRAAFAKRLNAGQDAGLSVRPVFLNQVHGTQVVNLNATTPDATVADACTSTQRGLACTIMVADCLPVLLTDEAGSRVAAAHAGWRGLADHAGHGVLESVFESFMAEAQSKSAQEAIKIIAWLGPCIGPGAFEVGPEVRTAFVSHEAQAADCFKALASGKWLCDLQGLARQRLQALGITQVYGNDGSSPWCTVGNPSRFFSHRRDRISGRMAACIWLA
jgi:polyphenol oxidase